jgi:hypothetical protein
MERGEIAAGSTVRLRDRGVKLPEDGCQAAIERFNFVSDTWNARGCFVNAFTNTTYVTVSDLSTGLMWQRDASPLRTYESGQVYVTALNARRFGGHGDWRLPTIEELLSLIETVPYDGVRLDPMLFARPNEYWSADAGPAEWEQWVVDAGLSRCRFTNRGNLASVRGVRTIDDRSQHR